MSFIIANMDIVQKIILNTIFVSIPEEIFWITFTFIIIGELNHIEDKKTFKKIFQAEDYLRIIVPSIVIAVFSNIIRYSGLNRDLILPVSIIIALIIIVIMSDFCKDANALQLIGKTFIFLILGSLAIFVTEFWYIPIVVYNTGKTLNEINNNIFLNFLVSLPSRLLQYFILIFCITKKRKLLKANFIKPILESKVLLGIAVFVAVVNIVFAAIMYKVICYDKILINLSFLLQSLIIIGILIFPMVNIYALVLGIYYERNKTVTNQKAAADKLRKITVEMKKHLDEADNDSLMSKIDDIGDTANHLFNEENDD